METEIYIHVFYEIVYTMETNLDLEQNYSERKEELVSLFTTLLTEWLT